MSKKISKKALSARAKKAWITRKANASKPQADDSLAIIMALLAAIASKQAGKPKRKKAAA